MSSKTSELLTYQQMSERYGFSTQTLATWVCRGRIPHVKLGSRCTRFRRSEIEAWLDACSRPADPDAPGAVRSSAGGE